MQCCIDYKKITVYELYDNELKHYVEQFISKGLTADELSRAKAHMVHVGDCFRRLVAKYVTLLSHGGQVETTSGVVSIPEFLHDSCELNITGLWVSFCPEIIYFGGERAITRLYILPEDLTPAGIDTYGKDGFYDFSYEEKREMHSRFNPSLRLGVMGENKAVFLRKHGVLPTGKVPVNK